MKWESAIFEWTSENILYSIQLQWTTDNNLSALNTPLLKISNSYEMLSNRQRCQHETKNLKLRQMTENGLQIKMCLWNGKSLSGSQFTLSTWNIKSSSHTFSKHLSSVSTKT